MTYPLAIFAPSLGSRSETFIRRHIESLVPGGTVVVADTCQGVYGGDWNLECPRLIFDQNTDAHFIGRLVRALARRVGLGREERVTRAKRFVREYGVRVILGEYLDWSERWLRTAREAGIRFFGHAHGYDVSQTLRQARWRTDYLNYNQSDGVITISQVSRKRLISLGLDAAKVHTIPYGVDVPSQPLTHIEQDFVRCLAVGRMVAKKAPILTLDAFRRAADVCPELRLDFIGSGELLPAVQQFIRAFQLGDRVTLHGAQPSEIVQSFMQRSDVFLQHSMTDPETGDEEGLPLAILEAMANSLPVVSTRHAGIPEAVVDQSSGYLVEEGDSAGMAERLVRLARDRSLRVRFGQAGWHRAKELFSWEKQRKLLLELMGINQVISHN